MAAFLPHLPDPFWLISLGLASHSLAHTDTQVPESAQDFIAGVLDAIKHADGKDCPVCLEIAEEPFLTPCAHFFCRTW